MATALDYDYYVYTLDDGTTQYSIKVNKTLGANADFGFGAQNLAKPILPAGWKPRYVLAQASDGRRRKCPVGSPSADIYTGVATSFTLPVVGSATAATFNVTATRGEKSRKPHAIVNV